MPSFANALTLAGLLAMGINAQTTADVCPDVAVVTVTGTVTETYCPDCGLTTPLPLPTGITINNNVNITNDIEVNIYVFGAIGPDGWTESTYTVTEECPCTAHSSGYIPQGFTTSVLDCDVCGPESTTVTVTCPEATATASEWTTYTTVYATPCATGLESATYTVTEACPCEATRADDHVPSGFTTSAYTWTQGDVVSTETITCPSTSTAAGNWSTAAIPATRTAATAAGSPSGAASAPTGGAATAGSTSVVAVVSGTAGSTASTGQVEFTGTGSALPQNLGMALFTVSALVLAAAIGF